MPPDSGVHSTATPQLIRMYAIVPADNLELSADATAMSSQLAVAVLSASSLSTSLDQAPVIEGQITLNNCKDVRIGHQYKTSGDVVINQKISVVGGEESLENLSDYCKQIIVRDVAESDYHTLSGTVIHRLYYVFYNSSNIQSVDLLTI